MSFTDLIVRISPISLFNKSSYKYAFIVHSRSIDDVYNQYPFLKKIPGYFVDLFAKYHWPITLSKITGLKSQKTGIPITGWIIAIPMTPRQMIENRGVALKRIILAIKLAEKKGAKIIGLGALTSSLSKGGLDLLGRTGVGITTGHAYTAYIVTQNVIRLTNIFESDKNKITVAVVGAIGSIGATTSKILAREGYKNIILIDLETKKARFPELINEMKKIQPNIKISISHKIKDIKVADYIITATNAPEVLIKADDLKSGAVVVDDAQPSDVHPEVLDREDVLVVEAGIVYTPKIDNHFDFGLKNKHDNFCCLGEVLILASNEWKGHYVIDRASLDLVDQISKAGEKLNFRLGDFQNFKEKISEEKIATMKRTIKLWNS